MPVKLNRGATDALAEMRAEAARVRAEREGEPGAFTAEEFADAVGNMTPNEADAYLRRHTAKGKYRQTKKVAKGRLRVAWVMEKKA